MSEPTLGGLAGMLAQLERRKKIYRLEYYKPYPKQQEFHNAIGKGTSSPAKQRMLMGGNQGGKTFCGAMEAAIHLTGRYPDWWTGTRYRHPIDMMVAGKTNESVRDVMQKELLGDPMQENSLGTGTIPIDCIVKPTRKVGVQNSFESCTVKHFTDGVYDGESRLKFRAYEIGFQKFMGLRFHVGWMDEEPPQEIWSQFLRGGLAQPNAILYMTMTPEEGMTAVVTQFVNDLKDGQSMTTLTWDDALHFSEEDKVKKLMAFPEHEREMRRNGSPLMGSGLIFSTPDDQITVDPFEIPRHWPQIIGIDFGWDHPFSATKMAWDRDNDCIYITNDYRESKALPVIHAAAINSWGSWIPVAWPHDGLNAEKGSGEQLRSKYIDAGVNMLRDKATNPPDFSAGQEEGQGGNSVEASIQEMINRFETGRLKVFKNCKNWLEEKRMYHRSNGKIVKLKDDTLSSSRYGIMMIRHARTISVKPRKNTTTTKSKGNWK